MGCYRHYIFCILLIVAIQAFNRNMHVPQSEFSRRIQSHKLNFDWKSIISFILENKDTMSENQLRTMNHKLKGAIGHKFKFDNQMQNADLIIELKTVLQKQQKQLPAMIIETLQKNIKFLLEITAKIKEKKARQQQKELDKLQL